MKNLNLFSGSNVFQLRLPGFVCWIASPIILIVLNLALMFNTKFVEDSTKLKSDPLQKGSPSLGFLAYFYKSPDSGATVPFDQIISPTDPFFFNMCLLYSNVCEMIILLKAFLLVFSLVGLVVYIYNRKCPNLKSFFSKKENSFWVMCRDVSFTLTISSITRSLFLRFYTLNSSLIKFINTDSFSYYYYNPPGLAMGTYRVLHLADYSPIFSYLNLEYINPSYILYLVTIIKYVAMLIVIFTAYFIIATATTVVYYSQDKTALSLPGGPASLNLFTKCFYIKNFEARIILLLSFFAISFILMQLASIVLYHYINIYEIG